MPGSARTRAAGNGFGRRIRTSRRVETGPPAPIADLLLAWGQGDAAAFDQLTPLIHRELRRLARCHMRGERLDHTLQTTAIAHEAYLRLVDTRRVQWRDPLRRELSGNVRTS